jgi:hypothetical protein
VAFANVQIIAQSATRKTIAEFNQDRIVSEVGSSTRTPQLLSQQGYIHTKGNRRNQN